VAISPTVLWPVFPQSSEVAKVPDKALATQRAGGWLKTVDCRRGHLPGGSSFHRTHALHDAPHLVSNHPHTTDGVR